MLDEALIYSDQGLLGDLVSEIMEQILKGGLADVTPEGVTLLWTSPGTSHRGEESPTARWHPDGTVLAGTATSAPSCPAHLSITAVPTSKAFVCVSYRSVLKPKETQTRAEGPLTQARMDIMTIWLFILNSIWSGCPCPPPPPLYSNWKVSVCLQKQTLFNRVWLLTNQLHLWNF